MLTASVTAQQPPAQQQPPTFASGTQVVQVDLRVFDKAGRFVTNLKPEDIEIKEDGAPQRIVSIALVGAALSAPSSPSSPSTPSSPSSPSDPSRPSSPSTPSIWLFVFDTLHLSPGGLTRSRDAVLEFLQKRFHAGDIGGIVIDGKMANNRLTTERGELVKAVDALRPRSDVKARQVEIREWPRLRDEFEAWLIAEHNDKDALQQAIIRACSEDPDACKATPPDMRIRQKAVDVVRTARAAAAISLNIVEALSKGLA